MCYEGTRIGIPRLLAWGIEPRRRRKQPVDFDSLKINSNTYSFLTRNYKETSMKLPISSVGRMSGMALSAKLWLAALLLGVVSPAFASSEANLVPVSYTHLTLPTKRIV